MAKPETVVREFQQIGKYRVRIIENGKGQSLDIREYISDSDTGFEGFTRRGIRLSLSEDVSKLAAVLEELQSKTKKAKR